MKYPALAFTAALSATIPVASNAAIVTKTYGMALAFSPHAIIPRSYGTVTFTYDDSLIGYQTIVPPSFNFVFGEIPTGYNVADITTSGSQIHFVSNSLMFDQSKFAFEFFDKGDGSLGYARGRYLFLDTNVGAVSFQGAVSSDGTIPYIYGVVPEPSLWALMLAGFLIIGTGLRFGRSTGVAESACAVERIARGGIA